MTNERKERIGSALICLAFAGLAAATAKAGGPSFLWALSAICCGFGGLMATGHLDDSLAPDDADTLDRIEAERLQEAADERRAFWLSDEGVVIHDGGPDTRDGAPSDGWLV